jgi:metal-responsive CopG/Arc/MetJ family transcriptional regulator
MNNNAARRRGRPVGSGSPVELHRTSLYVAADDVALADEIAAKQLISRSDVLRQAIRLGLERMKKDLKGTS